MRERGEEDDKPRTPRSNRALGSKLYILFKCLKNIGDVGPGFYTA